MVRKNISKQKTLEHTSKEFTFVTGSYGDDINEHRFS